MICLFHYLHPHTFATLLNNRIQLKSWQFLEKQIAWLTLYRFSVLNYLYSTLWLEIFEKLTMLRLFSFLVFTPAPVRSNWASNIEVSTSRVDVFEKVIFLMKSVKSNWLSGFLTRTSCTVSVLVSTMKSKLEQIPHQFSVLWKTLFFCFVIFLSQFLTDTSGFNITRILHRIDHKFLKAQHYLQNSSNETTMSFSSLQN